VLDGCNTTLDTNTSIVSDLPQSLYDQCLRSYNTLYALLWTIYGVHIGFSVIYILSAVLTCGTSAKIGWITRVSSCITLILLLTISAMLTDGLCTGADRLLGYSYPGCKYVYPEEFEGTFQRLEGNTYNDIVAVVLVYGMKTVLKVIQVWIPFGCTADGFCLRN